MPDDGAYVLEILADEEVDPLIKPAVSLFRLPLWLRAVVSRLLSSVWPQVATMAGAFNGSCSGLRRTYADADAYVALFTRTWMESGLDALICPGFPFPAPPHAYPAKIAPAAFITVLFNLLDFPSGVLPITHVSAEDVERLEHEYPSEEAVRAASGSVWALGLREPLYLLAKKASRGSEGMPVGVQVVGLPYQEETCLRVMKILETEIKTG
jgi:hypothetical protein